MLGNVRAKFLNPTIRRWIHNEIPSRIATSRTERTAHGRRRRVAGTTGLGAVVHSTHGVPDFVSDDLPLGVCPRHNVDATDERAVLGIGVGLTLAELTQPCQTDRRPSLAGGQERPQGQGIVSSLASPLREEVETILDAGLGIARGCSTWHVPFRTLGRRSGATRLANDELRKA